MRGIAVELTEDRIIDARRHVRDLAIILDQDRRFFEARRQLHRVAQLVRTLAAQYALQRLVEDEGKGVAVVGKPPVDCVAARERAAVRAQQYFGFQGGDCVDGMAPEPRIAVTAAADAVDIRKPSPDDIIEHRLARRNPHHQLIERVGLDPLGPEDEIEPRDTKRVAVCDRRIDRHEAIARGLDAILETGIGAGVGQIGVELLQRTRRENGCDLGVQCIGAAGARHFGVGSRVADDADIGVAAFRFGIDEGASALGIMFVRIDDGADRGVGRSAQHAIEALALFEAVAGVVNYEPRGP